MDIPLSRLGRCRCHYTIKGFMPEIGCDEHDTDEFRQILHLHKTLERLRIARELENELYQCDPRYTYHKKAAKHLKRVRNKV